MSLILLFVLLLLSELRIDIIEKHIVFMSIAMVIGRITIVKLLDPAIHFLDFSIKLLFTHFMPIRHSYVHPTQTEEKNNF